MAEPDDDDAMGDDMDAADGKVLAGISHTCLYTV